MGPWMIGKIMATGGLKMALLLGGLALWGWCAHHAHSQQTLAGDSEIKIRILGTSTVAAPPTEPFCSVNIQPLEDSSRLVTSGFAEWEMLPCVVAGTTDPIPTAGLMRMSVSLLNLSLSRH